MIKVTHQTDTKHPELRNVDIAIGEVFYARLNKKDNEKILLLKTFDNYVNLENPTSTWGHRDTTNCRLWYDVEFVDITINVFEHECLHA